ncbi:unnamed protein product [Heligmosomoides polygyrus]|uniref:FBA_2 domain-containing protein n=1 Tax=Heligmosomoides polygyrus TaxID=6339 RepID=A0A183GDU7_HELPZ|nr:unnamed protein product [Heligmosomoides polygyrus]
MQQRRKVGPTDLLLMEQRRHPLRSEPLPASDIARTREAPIPFLMQRKATVGMILRLVSSAEDPLCRSMGIDFSGRKHDAKTLLKQIFVYYNLEFLKLEGCELTDRDIFNVPEINCKIKYLIALRKKAHAKEKSEVPDGTRISAANLTKCWAIVECKPFNAMNLNQFMEKWHRCGKSGEGEHSVRTIDFFRHDFQEACTPTDAIKQYTCRRSGNSGKKPELKDHPEHLVENLIATVRDWAAMTRNERKCSSTGRIAATAGTHCSANVWEERWLKFGSGRCATESSFLDRNENGSASTARASSTIRAA